jgi:hypothetical protein
MGGTALLSNDKAAHRIVQKGKVTSNLGRWSWTQYKGHNNHKLKVFTAYCPNLPQGPFSLYSQHCSHMVHLYRTYAAH